MFINNTPECDSCGGPAELLAFIAGKEEPLCKECVALYPHAKTKPLGQIWLKDVTPEMITKKAGEMR